MFDERHAIISVDAVPSSPASTRFELASPASQEVLVDPNQPVQPPRAGGGVDDVDDARRAGQQQDGPAPVNPQSSTEPSHNTLSLPTAPGQAASLAIHSSLTHNPDESSGTQKADSARTADLKRHSSAANEKQTALDSQHDVHTADTELATTKTAKRGGKVADEIDPRYALDAIPSLDDYIRYVELLQDNWKDAPVIDIVYNDLSYIVKVSPEETRIPSIGRSFVDFLRWISFQMPKPVPLAVFKSDALITTTQQHGTQVETVVSIISQHITSRVDASRAQITPINQSLTRLLIALHWHAAAWTVLTISICRECSGVIPHGKMTLLLAPPGAGHYTSHTITA